MRDQERTRGRIALLLLGLLILVALGLIVGPIVRTIDVDAAEKLAGSILSPVVGLVGTVLGFYFGQNLKR